MSKQLFAYAKTKNCAADQRLCFRYTDRTIPLLIYTLIRIFKPLVISCGCTARFMSDLVGNPEDWFSHNESQIIIGIIEKKGRIKLDKPCGEKQWYRSACASQNAAETKTKGAATSYDSHGGICGPFFITLPRPCYFPPLTTGVYRGIHIFLIIFSLNINCWYPLHIGCEGIKRIPRS